MYSKLGDKSAQDTLREQTQNSYHCPWLKRDPNACDSLPDGIDNAEAGTVCPHNVYHHKQSVFANREAVSGTIDRLIRLVGAADLGLLSELDLDPLSVTELIVSKSELNRQESEHHKRESERARLEAEMNRERQNVGFRPGTHGGE